jgi:hypothetical protein
MEQPVERRDVDAMIGFATMALGAFGCAHPQLESCSRADQVRLSVRYAVTFLLTSGLVTVTPAARAGDRWLDAELPAPFDGDVQVLLEQAVQRAADEARKRR